MSLGDSRKGDSKVLEGIETTVDRLIMDLFFDRVLCLLLVTAISNRYYIMTGLIKEGKAENPTVWVDDKHSADLGAVDGRGGQQAAIAHF